MAVNIEDLKDHAPMFEYIRDFYPDLNIRMSGSVAECLCPFHNETDPSLKIFSDNKFKCFGCGEYGDIIDFVSKMEDVDLKEACKIVGDNVGYPVLFGPADKEFEEFKNVMDNHNRRYWVNLQHNPSALNYLMNIRGITPGTINVFRLGFTDHNEFSYRNDAPYISDRIAFPVLENNSSGRCVGMAYRGINNESPKYVNDPTSKYFVKGNLLYGYPMAIKDIKKKKFMFLVEGYMDVISMHQAGITNTLGAMGTAVTDKQIEIISKITDNVIIILDNDTAGKRNTERILPAMYQAGLNVAICNLEEVKDPADLCLKMDFDCHEIEQYISSRTSNALWSFMEKGIMDYKRIAITERTKVFNRVSKLINNVNDETKKDFFMNLLKKELDM